MEQTLKVEFLQDLEAELAQLPSYDLMLSILNKIHLATDEIMAEIPLYKLYLLLMIAKNKKMDEAVNILEQSIWENLKAQQEADKAEQRAKRAEQWAKQVEALQKSIESRLNSTGEN